MKRLLTISLFGAMAILCTNLCAQHQYYYEQYNSLYPDCDDNVPSEIYTIDEPYLEEPEFPGGGQVQMTRFVHFTTEMLDVTDDEGKQLKGKVLIKMVINRCGVAQNFEIIESLSGAHDAEAMRVAELLPIFKPGSLDGTRVKVAIVVPFYFMRTYVPQRKKIYLDDGSYYYEDEYNDDDDSYDDEYDDYDDEYDDYEDDGYDDYEDDSYNDDEYNYDDDSYNDDDYDYEDDSYSDDEYDYDNEDENYNYEDY